MRRGAARARTIEDLRRAARRRLPRMVFDFVDGGAEDEFTLAENRRAFSDLAFRARVLVDVAERPQATTLLGRPLALPVVLGPAGLVRMAGRAGEAAAAVAAERCGTVSVVSSGSSVSLADVASAVGEPQWFQLYPWGDRRTVRALMGKARDAGYEAMVVTVDVPVVGSRERDLRNGLTVPPRVDPRTGADVLSRPRWLAELLTGPGVTFANFTDLVPRTGTSGLAAMTAGLLNPGHTWADLEWMVAEWGGPVMLKGVMTGEDARRAADLGCAAVAVSNHGGRQADGLPGALDVLEEVVDEVGRDVEVVLDGGVRRGTDVVKALALGARACLVGRPWVFGLAAGGVEGSVRAVEILREEIDRTLALIGRPGVASLDRSALSARSTRGWRPLAEPAGCACRSTDPHRRR